MELIERKKIGKVVFFGDSITKGTYSVPGDPMPMAIAEPNFASLVQRGLGAETLVNYGCNGISYSPASPVNGEYSLVRTCADGECGDMIFLAAGTNDYGTSVPLGKAGDTSEYTFYGAVGRVFGILRQKNPEAPVWVLLPIPRLGEELKNEAGCCLEDYRKALEESAERYDFGVIDGRRLNIHPETPRDKERYIYDGTHINEAGHALLARLILQTVEKAK